VIHSRGYYRNGLRAWQSDMQKHHRQLTATHARMENMHHPDKPDLGRLIDLNNSFLVLIKAALEDAEDKP
jgi:hypothetical protein